MSMFKVGDRVKINVDSRFYGVNVSNPANTSGTVIRVSGCAEHNLPIYVAWDSCTSNSYSTYDLEYAITKKIKRNI